MPQDRDDIHLFFDLFPALFCIAGFDGYFKRLNRAWETTFGFSRTELMGAPYLDFVHPNDRALTSAEAAQLSGGTPSASFENRYRCRDGSYRWLLWSARPSLETAQIFAYAHDITDRKNAERRLAIGYVITRVLADSPSIFQAAPRLLEGIGETLGWEMGVLWQLAPSGKHLICSAIWKAESLRAPDFFPITRDARPGPGSGLAGRVWAENQAVWLPDVLATPNFSRAVAADESGLRGAFGFPIRHRGEVTGVMEFFARKIDKPSRYLLTMFEAMGDQIGQFVEHRRAEQQVRDYAASLEEARREQEEVAGRLGRLVGEIDQARRDAENGTRTKSEFLARMSHEIRTPLTAVMGMTELAMGTPLNAEQREYLETIDESSSALLRLINDILDFSKIEAHRFELDRTDFALRETVEGAVKTLALRAREKGLGLTCRIRKNVPDSLVGDTNRLRQVLLNLLSNAVKFTDRGEVMVQVQVEESQPDAAVLHFSVADTGVGVAPDMRTLIFDSFSQADTSFTRRYGGTGLGLTIASQLVAMMKGRIWVEERQTQGSVFHFTARFDLGDRHAHTRRQRLPAHLRGLPVLIVEENATSRRVFQETLQNWGMKPATTASGLKALAVVKRAARRRRPFSLLLIAADMPRVNGITLARQIRRLPLHRHASVILLAEAGRGAIQQISRLQAVTWLTKPVSQSELRLAILANLQADDRPARSRPARSTNRTAPLSILVAEDNPVTQRLILLMLEKIGHRGVIARNGEEAISIARRGSIDMVLMDVEMPGYSGLDATRAIRETEAAMQTHLPIIAMTAHALKRDRERCLAAGMDAYLSKPIRVEDLKRIIGKFTPRSAKHHAFKGAATSSHMAAKKLRERLRPV